MNLQAVKLLLAGVGIPFTEVYAAPGQCASIYLAVGVFTDNQVRFVTALIRELAEEQVMLTDGGDLFIEDESDDGK